MRATSLEALLVLQERDARCRAIERQLMTLPQEYTQIDADIAFQHGRLQAAQEAVRALEVKQKALEGDIAAAEEQVIKYKTQQLQVKKNEEYAALQHEIEGARRKVGDREDAVLALLDEIQAGQTTLKAVRAEVEQAVKAFTAKREALKANEGAARRDLEGARAAVAEAARGVPADELKLYEYVKGQVKRPPFIAPVEGGKCSGCHLKISAEVESQVRLKNEPVRCDNCGRLLYWA